MSLRETLELLIQVDANQGIRSVEAFASKNEQALQKATASISKYREVGAKMLSVGAAGLGVGSFLTMAASGDIEAARQLEAAISVTGKSISQYEDRIKSAVGQMVKFGHTDEAVSGALTTLTTSYGDAGRALDQMQLVADIAARKHISLADAAQLVARAHGGSARLFKEFGITVGTNAAGVKDYDGALTELSKRLKGQAEASASSFGGKLRELRAEVENQVSAFGQKWGPTIMAASGAMTVLGGVTRTAGAAIEFVQGAHAAAAFAAAAQARAEQLAAAGMVEAAAAARAEAAALGGAGAAGKGMIAALGPMALVAGGIAAAGFVISEFGAKTSSAEDTVKAFTSATNEELKAQAQKVYWLAEGTGALKKLIESGKDGEATLLRMRDAQKEGSREWQKLTEALDKNRERQKAVAQAESETADAADKLTSATDKAKKAAEEQAKATRDLAAAQKAATDPFFALIDAAQQNADANRKVTESHDALTKAVRDFGLTSPEAAKASRDLDAAQIAAGKSAISLDEALAGLKASVEKNPAALNDAKAALDRLVASGAISQDTAKQLGADFDVAAGKTTAWTQALLELNRQLVIDRGDYARMGGARASGGPVEAGRPYQVGEGGTSEMFVPSRSGTVVPDLAVNGRPGGTATLHIEHFYAAEQTPDEIAASLAFAVKTGRFR